MPTSQATSSPSSPESPNTPGKRVALADICAGCAVGEHEIPAALCGSCACACHAGGVRAVVVTPLAYQMIARADKARTMARVLHGGGMPSAVAEMMTSEVWKQFHVDLKAKQLLGAHSTTPSPETVARTLAELRKLEQAIPVCGTARIRRLPEAA